MIGYCYIILSSTFLYAGLINPENDSELSYTHILFEWEQSIDAVGYEIEVSPDNLFEEITNSWIWGLAMVPPVL